MANSAQSFKAPQCEKRPRQKGAAAQKVSCRLFSTNPVVPAAISSTSAQNSSMYSYVVAIGLGEARRHELDKFRERVAVVEAEFRSTLSKKSLSGLLAMVCAMTHSAAAIARVAVRRRDAGPSQEGRALRARLTLGARVRPRSELKMNLRFSQEPPSNRSTMLGAFAHPAFAIVWTASTCALIGIAMYDTASGWLMTTFDLNPFDVSLLHTATTLPIFLFTLPAGAIADIVDPRRMIIAVSYAIAALMAIFAAVVALDFVSPVLLLLTTFVLSAAWSLNTPAWLSIVPQLVPKPVIPGAMAAHSVGYNLSRTLGPALGGFIIVTLRGGRAALDFCRRQSGGDRRAHLVARAGAAESVPARRKIEQRSAHRPSAYREQPPLCGPRWRGPLRSIRLPRRIGASCR